MLTKRASHVRAKSRTQVKCLRFPLRATTLLLLLLNMNSILGTTAGRFEADITRTINCYQSATATTKPAWWSDTASVLGKAVSGSIIVMKDGSRAYVPLH